jgi:hypothetical protein
MPGKVVDRTGKENFTSYKGLMEKQKWDDPFVIPFRTIEVWISPRLPWPHLLFQTRVKLQA